MSDTQIVDNSDNSNALIEEAITTYCFKYYECKHFSDIQEIGSGTFGKVYRAKWKNSEQYLALKAFSVLDNAVAKEIVREVSYMYMFSGFYNFGSIYIYFN